jgi:hypothetical protein
VTNLVEEARVDGGLTAEELGTGIGLNNQEHPNVCLDLGVGFCLAFFAFAVSRWEPCFLVSSARSSAIIS